MSVVLVRYEEKRKGRHWRDVTTHVGGMIPGRNDAIGRQNLSTRSMAQKGTFGTSGTVSATAEPAAMVLFADLRKRKVRVRVQGTVSGL